MITKLENYFLDNKLTPGKCNRVLQQEFAKLKIEDTYKIYEIEKSHSIMQLCGLLFYNKIQNFLLNVDNFDAVVLSAGDEELILQNAIYDKGEDTGSRAKVKEIIKNTLQCDIDNNFRIDFVKIMGDKHTPEQVSGFFKYFNIKVLAMLLCNPEFICNRDYIYLIRSKTPNKYSICAFKHNDNIKDNLCLLENEYPTKGYNRYLVKYTKDSNSKLVHFATSGNSVMHSDTEVFNILTQGLDKYLDKLLSYEFYSLMVDMKEYYADTIPSWMFDFYYEMILIRLMCFRSPEQNKYMLYNQMHIVRSGFDHKYCCSLAMSKGRLREV